MDQFEPIYNIECSVCTSAPVVGVRAPSGKIASTSLCGPCFFGETLMLDESEWNKPKDATE